METGLRQVSAGPNGSVEVCSGPFIAGSCSQIALRPDRAKTFAHRHESASPSQVSAPPARGPSVLTLRPPLPLIAAHADQAVGDRGNVPDQQKRGRPRPLPGPPLPSLVPTHHPGHARHRLPRHHPRHRSQKRGPTANHDELIPLSSNEIRRLLAALAFAPISNLARIMTWSHWRRRRQHQARACHYRRRGHRPP